jgi:hypothetical protein
LKRNLNETRIFAKEPFLRPTPIIGGMLSQNSLKKHFYLELSAYFIRMSSQTTIFVILSGAKNLSVEAAEIHNEATLRSE